MARDEGHQARTERSRLGREQAPVVPGTNDEPPTDDWEDNDAICARYIEPLARFFWNKVPSSSNGDVQDLVQETFLRFMKKRAQGPIVDRHGQGFRGPGECLRGIASKLLLEHLRKVMRASNVDSIAELSVADMSRGISSQVSLAERRSLVHELLRELPLYQQMAIEDCYYQQMSYKEIAYQLDVPLGTVATLCRRGRDTLRKRFEFACKGKPLPKIFANEDHGGRRDALAEYHWYDPATGAIDAWGLLRAVTNGRHERAAALPPWLATLEIPRALPDASAIELWELARGTLEAWVDAGRPR